MVVVADHLRIGILGSLDVSVGGSPIDLSSPSQRILLLRLVDDVGSPVSTDALADAIWGDRLPKDPANAVRYHVWKLRDALGVPEAITTTPGGYVLRVPDDGIDADEFTRLVGSAELAATPVDALGRLDRALDLWRGPPFSDARDAEFAQASIRRLEELRDLATERRAIALVDAGRTAEAIPQLEGLLAERPYREAMWSALMTALYREGRQHDALRAYQRARSVLGDDLGLEPSPELRDLEARILVHDDSVRPRSAVPSNLPAPLASFVGRTRELAEVRELITGSRLVTIVGVGGAGKTRLALEAARGMIDEHPGGVWIADLVPSRSGDDLLDAVGDAIGFASVERDVTRHADIVAFLRPRTFLLVLDNGEHVIDDVADTVTEILEHCPNGRVLVTSRTPVRLPGETVYAIPVLSLPPLGASWDDVAAATASALFIRRASEAGVDIDATPDHALAVARLSHELEGIPLAIEMAAPRLRTTTLEELAEQVTTQLDAFGSRRGAADRHRTMEAMVEWSYRLLDEDARRLFRRLGVFIGGFTIDAAEYICATDETPPERVRPIIDGLVEGSLVEWSDARSARYRLLEPVRLFALDRLAEAEELEMVRSLHADAFHDIVTAAAPDGRSPRRHDVLTGFHSEAANLRAALEHLEREGDTDRLCAMVAALTFYFIDRLRYDDRRRWSAACEPFVDDQPPSIAAMLHLLAAHARVTDRAGTAPDEMKEALRAARASGNELIEADVTVAYLQTTDALAFDELLSPSLDVGLAEGALAVYRRHGDRWSEPHALEALANAKLWHHEREGESDPSEVVALAREARALAQDIGDEHTTMVALAIESAAFMATDPDGWSSADEVESIMATMLDTVNRSSAPDSRCDVLANIAWYRFRSGDVEGALEISDQWIRTAEEASVLFHAASAHTATAVFLEEVDRERALDHVVRALDHALERGVDRQTVWMVEIAVRFLADSDPDLAACLIGAAEHQRLDGRNAMPPWDVGYYGETRRRVEEAAGPRFADAVAIGATWPIRRAAEEARAAIRAD